MVHKDGVGTGFNSGVDQRQTGRDAADHARDLGPPFDLQAVGAVVLEALGLQQAVKRLQELLPGYAHARYCRAALALAAGAPRLGGLG